MKNTRVGTKGFISTDLRERFFAKVAKGDGCWLWTGATDARYGTIWANGKNRKAHIVSYELHVGAVPPGLEVMHKCDTPRCVNPDHLTVGTHADNLRDCVAKGRHKPIVRCGDQHYSHIRPWVVLRGEKHGIAKLRDASVREIKDRLATGAKIKPLARDYGVSATTIRNIRNRETWRHV